MGVRVFAKQKIEGCIEVLILLQSGVKDRPMTKMTYSTLALSLSLIFSSQARAIEPVQAMGQGLFEQQGSNSCLFCHGIDGKKGNVAASANLTKPKAWKVYKALGGDAAFNKDPKDFVSKMRKATVALIKSGAIRHNATFKEPWFNWKATGVSPYNAQMMGLGGAATQQWLKRMKDRGVTPDIAAESLWLHLVKLDSESVLSKGQ